jgi:restriction system protein
MYHIHIKHDGLKKYRRLSGTDEHVLEQRARIQTESWNARWRRWEILDRHTHELLRQLPDFDAQKAYAAKLSAEAQKTIASLENILREGLETAPFVIEMLHDSRIFPEPRPVAPVDQPAPREPVRSDPCFEVTEIDLKDLWPLLLLSGRRRREKAVQLREQAAQLKYDLARQGWLEIKAEIVRQNARAKALFEMALDEWWQRAQAHKKLQQDENIKIDEFRLRYSQRKPDAVVDFLDAVLSHSELPEFFPTQWDLGYSAETGALIVDYELPSLQSFPSLKAVKFDVLRDAFEQCHLSTSEVARLYEGAIYQTCLRILHDLFAADEGDALVSITFNGWVIGADKIGGTQTRVCMLSVEAAKATIQQASLGAMDAKAYFKMLKGIASEDFSGFATVVPIRHLKEPHVWTIAANDALDPRYDTRAESSSRRSPNAGDPPTPSSFRR